jgi:hypothetical protein
MPRHLVQRLAALVDLLQQGEAVDLELRGRDGLHGGSCHDPK